MAKARFPHTVWGEEEKAATKKKKKAHIKIIECENNSQRNELLESERLKQTACNFPFRSSDVIQYWADRWAHISILKRFLFFCARSHNKFMESNLICVGTGSCHKTQTHTCRRGWNWKLRSTGMCHARLEVYRRWRCGGGWKCKSNILLVDRKLIFPVFNAMLFMLI